MSIFEEYGAFNVTDMTRSSSKQCNMSLNIPNLMPQRTFCYLNFISVTKPQKFGNETYATEIQHRM